jgi:hypothetical protein
LNESGTTIDLISALGRLLCDGSLREAFRADPASVATELRIRESDRESLLQLAPEDLEIQAGVLLRKRFEAVRFMIPETCEQLGDSAWKLFREYSTPKWPAGQSASSRDADQFLRWLQRRRIPCVPREWNWLQFALSGKKLSLHWIRRHTGNKRPSAIQILWRSSAERLREMIFYLRL